MKKIFFTLFAFLFLIFSSKYASAQNSAYTINNFESNITVNQDTSLTVEEKITAEFFVEKHGIFRTIPATYSANGRTIQAKFNLISVTDETGSPYQYSTSRVAQSEQIKIGDPDVILTGEKIYVIKYHIDKVLQRYDTYDEVYWNVTGHEWDTDIKQSSVKINSPYAEITKIKCFTGVFGGSATDCESSDHSKTNADFTVGAVAPNSDFTIVVGLNNKNKFVFPTKEEQIVSDVTDNFGYIFVFLPIIFAFFFWWKKGRDERYLSDNVYVKPDNTKSRSVSLFEREHLPLAYSPIQGITPSQLGTILDEKVDIQDVVAEIVELARLKFLKIEKIEEKGFLHTDTDFVFTKINSRDKSRLVPTNKNENLKDFQKFLLDKIFETGDVVKLSDLKNKFYVHLSEFKNKLYKNMGEEKYFSGNPQNVKGMWFAIYFVVGLVIFTLVSGFSAQTDNPGPMVLFWILTPVGLLFVFSMSKRTAWGHSLLRQAKGLQYYIGEGKWRQEIAEKNLFIDEILPLAICLGVVNKLASQMKDLEMMPPSYINGFTTGMLVSDFSHFQSTAASTLASSPSGHSSWSGGSGFSGGSSGGGFGGGGGGSW